VAAFTPASGKDALTNSEDGAYANARTTAVSYSLSCRSSLKLYRETGEQYVTKQGDTSLFQLLSTCTTVLVSGHVSEEIVQGAVAAKVYDLIPSSGGQSDRPLAFLPIYFTGLSSGNFWQQLLCVIRNVLGLSLTREMQDATAFMHERLQRCKLKYPNTEIRPLLMGHSMGALFASYLSIKNGWLSLCLNPLGMGSGLRRQVGEKNLKCVDGELQEQHLSIVMPHDCVASTERFAFLRHVRTPGLVLVTKDYAKELELTSRSKIHNGQIAYLKKLLSPTA
jgi:hypothetical protein